MYMDILSKLSGGGILEKIERRALYYSIFMTWETRKTT